MDKNGEIREGVTPPEKPRPGEKQASSEQLESHVTNRLADSAVNAKRQQSSTDRR